MIRPLRIVIPGGSGQVGSALARHFQAAGHHVIVLTRSPFAAPWQTVHWDGLTEGSFTQGSLTEGSWTETLNGADVVINLAGRSVNCRYNLRNRTEIYNSRILTTRLLGQVFSRLASPPRLWMNASTATIYRHSIDQPMDEASGELGGYELVSPGPFGRPRRAPDSWNFSISVAKDWEAEFFTTFAPNTRKVALRSAITLCPTPGNAFEAFLNLVRFSLGGPQGNGRQFVSWIHEADFCRAIDFLIQREDLDGPVNLASPNPLPNCEFMLALREAWGMPNGIPAPAWLIEIAAFFLRTESELVLKSRRVVPTRLLDAGFTFQFPDWPEAAEDLVRQWRRRA
jgi:NAD dependent epimerase/dehydratase family enzyme